MSLAKNLCKYFRRRFWVTISNGIRSFTRKKLKIREEGGENM